MPKSLRDGKTEPVLGNLGNYTKSGAKQHKDLERIETVETEECDFKDVPQLGLSVESQRLSSYVWCPEERVFIVDDHNHALPAWYAANRSGLIEDNAPLVHVDGHSDSSTYIGGYIVPETMEELEDVGVYANASNFIDLAKRLDTVGPVEEWGMYGKASCDLGPLEETFEEKEGFIMDLDIDVFGSIIASRKKEERDRRPSKTLDEDIRTDDVVEDPEVDMDFSEHYRVFAKGIRMASITTVAISPGFIAGDVALDHIHGIAERY